MINLQSRKLKPDKSVIFRFFMTIFLGAAALTFIIVVLDAGSWGPGLHTFDYGLMVFYSLLGLVYLILYFKTKNRVYLVLGCALLLFIPYILTSQSSYSNFRSSFYIIWGGLFLIGGPVRRRFNPHFRQVLELAARPVDELHNGFTPRPFPAGRWKYSKEEIINFGKFMMKHWITTTYFGPEHVILVIGGFSWRYFFFGKPNLQKLTCVSFDFAGNVSVNITQTDYLKFRDQLTFDQLCASLGNLIKSFLMDYQMNEESKILTLIDEEMSRSHWFFSKLSGAPVSESAPNKG